MYVVVYFLAKLFFVVVSVWMIIVVLVIMVCKPLFVGLIIVESIVRLIFINVAFRKINLIFVEIIVV